jgi:RNA polymerase sigma-70 factor, ECF subfamily
MRNTSIDGMQTATATAELLGLGKRERALSELDDIDALVRTHRARLLRFVMFSVGDEDVAASIVQDCFLKAWANRANFRGESSVATWLTSIAVNLVRDHQRTRKVQFWRKAAKTATDVMEVASILPGNESSPERQLLARERAAAVVTALDDLSANQRAVFLMRFSEEMELADIALAMKMPVNTVKTHLHRAVRAVRQRVGGAQ